MGYETRLFINGEFVDSVKGEVFTLYNPANGEKVADVQIAGPEDVERAIAAAKTAQEAWAALPGAARAACLYKMADLIEEPENAKKLKELDAVAMGRPVGVQDFDIIGGAARYRFEASLIQSLVGESSLLTPGHLNLVLRQPFGLTASIIPWNMPLLMFGSKVAPSTAAGNVHILKSSEKSPLAALFLAELTVKAGFPPGVVQVLSGLGATGKLLAEHMEIRKISFTGSTRTGRLIAQAAAMSNLKEVSLELGGKSPTIIFDDADLDKAVAATSYSITWNSGQICIANSRLYVHESIADAFLAKFKVAFSKFKHGDPLDPATTLGPQADKIQGDAVAKYIEIGKADGKLEQGGDRTNGSFFTPTIFTGIPDDSLINKEEVFGPVVVIHTFTDEKDVIRRANDTSYGLYAAVYTKNLDRAIRVAKALESGHVGINTTSPDTSYELPFGGTKMSGMGRECGIDSLKRWTEEKSVVISHD